MSLVLRTIRSFPSGKGTQELLVLVGAGFDHDRRVAALAELNELVASGFVQRGRDGKWRPVMISAEVGRVSAGNKPVSAIGRSVNDNSNILTSAPASFEVRETSVVPVEDEPDDQIPLDARAMLRYWRSALRSDPRGATTQVTDKHGIEWCLVSGRGPVVLQDDQALTVTVKLDALPDTFREALLRRDGAENALALGWPLHVTRRKGVPVVQPVGLFAAQWQRDADSLVVTIATDDILVNPDWIKGASRASGWSAKDLSRLFADEDELRSDVFLEKVRDAVASQVKGTLSGRDLKFELDCDVEGVFDAAGLFLPSENSFTAGAARNLEAIADWSDDKLQSTALAPILGFEPFGLARFTPVTVGPLNGEQSQAVDLACQAPLTVVTGPPGTGKSQAIVSMAASVLLNGGSVLVASKNHQALDAVEDRLGALASSSPFITRTLKPEADVDVGFDKVIKALLDQDSLVSWKEVDSGALGDLMRIAATRRDALIRNKRKAQLQCRIAELIENIDARRHSTGVLEQPKAQVRLSTLQRVVRSFFALFQGRRSKAESDKVRSGESAEQELARLRAELAAISPEGDPVDLGERVAQLAKTVLPQLMRQRTHVPDDRRRELGEIFDNWTFAGGRGALPPDLSAAICHHRPLWLASVLGAPKRIPLHPGLFDLVIFDEASQCDIASALPLFARARRAVVVGDDQQLSFIAQLGEAQDRNLMQAQGLPLTQMGRFAQSKRSLFDCASRVPGVARVTLRHQYRSAGPIVDYISKTFYGGQLLTSHDPKGLIPPIGGKPGLSWQDVPAPALPLDGNVNPAEVSAIVEHLKLLLMEQGFEGSIGVITPFRAQVAALQTAVADAIPGPLCAGADLRVGTVDGFQGQERDLILFSPCVGPRSPQSGLTFFQKDRRRLNVAVSRARAVAIIFGDLSFARSGTSEALRRLAAYATEPRQRLGADPFDSEWERRVFHALKEHELDPQPQHEIAGRRLDFALFGANGIKLDLEVDGRRWHQTPDGRRKTDDLWRDHQMKSLGWRVRRFWVDELAKDMEGCIDIIERDLS
ncbi:AAA domain-containing protein [Kordiimonas sp.]|uniref:AAA domain-containing protein n=1 Tax=Kordiimonas sp. TaxID=1970157 RepID=UPI003A955A1C